MEIEKKTAVTHPEVQGLEGDKPASLIEPLAVKLAQPAAIVKVVEMKKLGLIAHIRRGKVRDAVEARRMVPKKDLEANPDLMSYALVAVLTEFTEKAALISRRGSFIMKTF